MYRLCMISKMAMVFHKDRYLGGHVVSQIGIIFTLMLLDVC